MSPAAQTASAAAQRAADAQGRPPAVVLRGVSKEFGDQVAVQPVDLVIGDGEFFSILGPSGCGKTTLMRMITGFEQPTSGVVELDGRDVTGTPTRHRDLNMLFQSYALFPHLTVRDNVAFELRVRKAPKAEIESRTTEALELVRLAHLADRKPSQLSGGQKQRAALARAVVGRPKVVLLDEPLGALDQQLRKEMQIELKRMQREVGITFVYVTHDQEEALTMSDRIAVMSHGVIEQIGSPQEIYDRPSTKFVAGFIGNCTLIDVELPGGSAGELISVALPSRHRVEGVLAEDAAPGSSGTLLVRPERVQLASEGEGIPGVIAERFFLGDEWRCTVDAQGTAIKVAIPSAHAETALVAASEQTPVVLSWRPRDARIVVR